MQNPGFLRTVYAKIRLHRSGDLILHVYRVLIDSLLQNPDF